MSLTIVDLGELDDALGFSLVHQLATLHIAEWGHLYDPSIWNAAIAVGEFAAMRDPNSASRTLVAFDGPPSSTMFVGSVSILETDDLDDWAHVRPWLASLLVLPSARGRRIGSALTNAAVLLAASRGDAYVHLFTPEHVEYYERLGWRVVSRAVAADTLVTVMARGSDSHSARRSVVSRWVGDPDFGGAYSYLRPGGTSADRDALAAEVLARVWLAGEYTWSAGPGTLHGAWLSGERAAAAVLEREELRRIAVIGSGMAGIGAARLLQHSGREVVIFESSARPFGRAATDRTVGGPIHLGGAWMHGTVGHPLRAVVDATPWSWDPAPTFVVGHGRLDDDDESRLAALYEVLETRLDALPADNRALGPSLRAIVDDLAEGALDSAVLMCWARGEFENLYAAPLDDLALAARAEHYSLPGDDHLITSPLDTVLEELSSALTINLSARVLNVHSADSHVTLDFANRPSERFDAVICATPLPPIKTRRIVFDPPIPDAVATSLNRIGCGPIAKVVTTFDEPFWLPHRAFSLTGPEPQPLEFFVDVSTVVGEPTLCGFAVGDHAAAMEAMTEDERCRLVDRLLTEAGVRDPTSSSNASIGGEGPVRFPRRPPGPEQVRPEGPGPPP